MLVFRLGRMVMEAGETECISYVRRIIQSERNEPMFERRQLQVVIDQTRTGISENSARWRVIDQQKNIDQVGFYETTGAETPIILKSADSLSGIRFLNPLSWTPRTPVEFATHLSMYMAFEADYPLTGDISEIMGYSETITNEDPGPVRINAIETDTGPVETFITSLHPKRYLIQQGFARARSTYPLWNDPILRLGTLIERSRTRAAPDKNGNGWLGYGVAWRYVFLIQEPELGIFPRLR